MEKTVLLVHILTSVPLPLTHLFILSESRTRTRVPCTSCTQAAGLINDSGSGSDSEDGSYNSSDEEVRNPLLALC